MHWINVRIVPALLTASLMVVSAAAAAHSPSAAPETGFLVVAADRGFQGNEEIRDAFEALARSRNAALAVATDERTRESLREALGTLAEHGARRVVVLPAFVSASDAQLAMVKRLLAESEAPLPVSFATAFGDSYLAVEALAEGFRAVREPKGRRVIVVGYGDASSGEIQRDWERLAARAAEGFGFSSVRTAVWNSGRSAEYRAQQERFKEGLAAAARDGERPIVVPFHLGRKADSMMSFDAALKRALPTGAEIALLEPAGSPAFSTWMMREANRHVPLAPGELGVVVLAHGADYHWNETIRGALQPLEARYKIEYCFSMADQPLVERSVRRLESRGARAAVIVRVFGFAASFRAEVERMIGLDIERRAAGGAAHAAHGESSGPSARIRSAMPMVTVGGVEDDALFAEALLDRARELSKNPAQETVILVAHGTGGDAENDDWLRKLGSIGEQMRANGGAAFRAIRAATWREDWPEKRAAWVAKARTMVEEAARDGGRALVIPARVNGRGPEREYLKGLDFELGSGFAPHPHFARWVEKQIELGAAELGRPTGAGAPAESDVGKRHH